MKSAAILNCLMAADPFLCYYSLGLQKDREALSKGAVTLCNFTQLQLVPQFCRTVARQVARNVA